MGAENLKLFLGEPFSKERFSFEQIAFAKATAHQAAFAQGFGLSGWTTIIEGESPNFIAVFYGSFLLTPSNIVEQGWAHGLSDFGGHGARCGRGASGLHSHAERRNEKDNAQPSPAPVNV